MTKDTNSSNYKDTLNLPQTDFPMKGNLATSEPQRMEKWQSQDIYQKMLQENGQKGLFVLPDGPPYANGSIHIGHVLNKVLKDIVIKYKNMSGYQAAFIPGWDCHGLPIELKVTKKLGGKRQEMTDAQVRELCRKEALHWVDHQRAQFQRLGILAEWDQPYLTLNPDYEAEEVRVLAKIFSRGFLYRGEKPVNWCPTLQTALAAAEVEYQDHKSPSIYVKFPLQTATGDLQRALDQAGLSLAAVSLVIWTTTPWTLPANVAIALSPQADYGFYRLGDEILVIAEELKDSVAKECGLEGEEGLSTPLVRLKGQQLEGAKALHPFMKRDSQVVLGDHVTLETGTGAVHTAPGHGLDDYHVGLKYSLPVLSPVDPAGRFTDEVPMWKGLKIWDANPKIVEHLRQSGHLLGFKELVHSYPHNPRSKTPLIFRSTPQWFIRMDELGKESLRQMALQAAESEIEFVPQWGAQRLQAMLSNSPDWCLSRQRVWGVPIPVFYCANCGEPLVSEMVMNRVADKMESTGQGIEAYHSLDVKEFVEDQTCGSCGHREFQRGKDILDVWFDSGVCHSAVQKKRKGLSSPADIYLEGSDQHRGWFQTSLLSSLAAHGELPFKALITHGFVNDAKGYKMSKSQGNAVDPAEVIQKSGAEILRLWVAYEDYGQDVNVGDEIFQRITDTYRRLRNTLRFMLGNLADFDPAQDQVAYENMRPLDQWALHQLNGLVTKSTKAYDAYDFYKVYHALNNFFTVDLSATYLDILKDRLYTWKKDGAARRSAQTAVYLILRDVCSLMAPILSFLAEETYEHTPGEKKASVLLEPFPQPLAQRERRDLEEKFSLLLDVRSQTSKKLEELRQKKVIGSSLDAQIVVTADKASYTVLNEYRENLREFFIVSHVELREGSELSIEALRAEGEKCPRCWHYSPNLNQNSPWPGVCPKCVEALS